MNLVPLLGGMGLATVGILGIFGAWKGRLPGGRWTALAGWAFVGLSGWLWVAALGPEFGLSYGILYAGLVAWLAVLGNQENRTANGWQGRDVRKTRLNVRSALRHLPLFLLAVPVAGAAGTFVSIALCGLLPLSQVNAIVLAVFAMPVVWGLASYWACADPRRLRPAAGLLAVTGLSALVVYG